MPRCVHAVARLRLSVAAKNGAVKPAQPCEVIVDTTEQPKNVLFPTDARLLNRARDVLVWLAKGYGVNHPIGASASSR
jgi:hypothetical protein